MKIHEDYEMWHNKYVTKTDYYKMQLCLPVTHMTLFLEYW